MSKTMSLAAFKRTIRPGAVFECELNERIPERAGKRITITGGGSSVLQCEMDGKGYRFEWPKASQVEELTPTLIAYRLPGGELVRHRVTA